MLNNLKVSWSGTLKVIQEGCRAIQGRPDFQWRQFEFEQFLMYLIN